MASEAQSQPLVTIVIPNLNTGKRLVRTLESVLKQDYPFLECLVVDGGSTDESQEILSRYRGRIEWVYEPPRGHADAINKGLMWSRGEIVTWLPAGDIHLPGAVRRAVEYFQAHPEAAVVYGDCLSIEEDGRTVGPSYLHEWDLEYAVEHCDHCIPQPASFIRRRILEQVGWIDTTLEKQDHDLWLRIGLKGGIHHIPVAMGGALNHPGAVSARGDRMARSCVELTRKFFTLEGVPEKLRKKKKRAMSNAYLRGIRYAWTGGRHWPIIFDYTLRAILADPSNTWSVLRLFRKGFLSSTWQASSPKGFQQKHRVEV
jgi:glycosyltransferase involved in cell wall biosynthesis